MTTQITLPFGFHADLMVLVLFGIIAIIVFLFWYAQRDNANPINVADLVVEDGKLSKVAVMMFGSFLATTWVLIHLELNARLDVGLFGAYLAAWVAPIVTRILKGPQSAGDK